ncbi:hypothetical protein G9A89_003503 [Geosiphon pyriformis]|nr:hypothetical protein G9A89_003503 [Geosiphon pyriformis]
MKVPVKAHETIEMRRWRKRNHKTGLKNESIERVTPLNTLQNFKSHNSIAPLSLKKLNFIPPEQISQFYSSLSQVETCNDRPYYSVISIPTPAHFKKFLHQNVNSTTSSPNLVESPEPPPYATSPDILQNNHRSSISWNRHSIFSFALLRTIEPLPSYATIEVGQKSELSSQYHKSGFSKHFSRLGGSLNCTGVGLLKWGLLFVILLLIFGLIIAGHAAAQQ